MSAWPSGHERQRAAWLGMRRSGRVPHALLLTGPSGIGKRLWSLAAARDLLCLTPKEDGPCGACDSCRSQSHPDLMTLAPERGHRDLRIEDLLPLLEWLVLTPALSRRKVAVLDQAEAATLPTAPALLKLLEEPPDGTHLFLVTSRPKAVIPTVLSRCRRLSFAPLDRAAFRKALGAKDSEALFRVSRGSPGEALRMLESGLLDQRAGLLELVGAPRAQALALAEKRLIPRKPSAKDAEEATPTEIRRREAVDRLNLLSSLLRDRMAPEEARMHPDLPKAPPADLTREIRAVEEALDCVRGNVDLNLTLECCALALAR